MLSRIAYQLTLWVVPMLVWPHYWPLVVAELLGSVCGWLFRHDPIWDVLVHIAMTSTLSVAVIVGCEFEPATAMMFMAWYAAFATVAVVIPIIVDIYKGEWS